MAKDRTDSQSFSLKGDSVEVWAQGMRVNLGAVNAALLYMVKEMKRGARNRPPQGLLQSKAYSPLEQTGSLEVICLIHLGAHLHM